VSGSNIKIENYKYCMTYDDTTSLWPTKVKLPQLFQ